MPAARTRDLPLAAPIRAQVRSAGARLQAEGFAPARGGASAMAAPGHLTARCPDEPRRWRVSR